jgi:hypothetical protein
MRIRTPKLPDPAAIRHEIEALKARIGELRALLPLAEVQHLRRSLDDHGHRQKPATAVTR